MKRLAHALLILLALSSCSKLDERVGARTSADAPSAEQSHRHLAIQHAIRIDADQDQIAALHEIGQTTCRQAVADLCTVLESQIDTGRAAYATLKLRARPEGVRKVIAALAKQRAITEQSSTAEDLAGPIEDGAKKLAMLTDYRTRLEALRERAGNDVDALIKVNRELAQVQSELETSVGNQARLVQRVETEILTVSIRSEHNRSFWQPIAFAINDFGGNLSRGVSIAVTGIAYLLPWAVLLALTTWAVRKLWRRRKPVRLPE